MIHLIFSIILTTKDAWFNVFYFKKVTHPWFIKPSLFKQFSKMISNMAWIFYLMRQFYPVLLVKALNTSKMRQNHFYGLKKIFYSDSPSISKGLLDFLLGLPSNTRNKFKFLCKKIVRRFKIKRWSKFHETTVLKLLIHGFNTLASQIFL